MIDLFELIQYAVDMAKAGLSETITRKMTSELTERTVKSISRKVVDEGGRIVDKTFSQITDSLQEEIKEINHRIIIEPKATELALLQHKKDRMLWCSELIHSGMHKSIPIECVFVPLTLTDDPKQFRMQGGQIPLDADVVLNSKNNLIILGDLGSGKTTQLKRHAVKLWNDEITKSSVIFVRFREFDPQTTFLGHMKSLFRLDFASSESKDESSRGFIFSDFRRIEIRAFASFIDALGLTVICDGFDEAPLDNRDSILDEISQIAERLLNARIIVSSRPPDIIRSMPAFLTYEIEPLNAPTVEEFARRWFNASAQSSDAECGNFLKELSDTPYLDLVDRPLMLTNLCILFEKYKRLPQQPVEVYGKIVRLCLEEWDSQQGIKRSSRYSQLDPFRKEMFLANFAYFLLYNKGNTSEFTSGTVEDVYREIHQKFGLPLFEHEKVAEEIQSTTGIIVQSRYKKFEFSHKSICEYLIAEYLIRSGAGIESDPVINSCPNECAVAAALFLEPDRWLKSMVYSNSGFISRSELWVKTFLGRILIERPVFVESDLTAVSTIWFAYCLRKGDLESFNKFIEHPKVDRSLASYFRRAELKHDKDSLQIELTFPDCKSHIQPFRYRDFERALGKFFD